jgi:hypothetical protein
VFDHDLAVNQKHTPDGRDYRAENGCRAEFSRSFGSGAGAVLTAVLTTVLTAVLSTVVTATRIY